MTDTASIALRMPDECRIARMAALLAAVLPPLATFMTGVPLLPILVPSAIFALMAFLANRAEPSSGPVLLSVAMIGLCIVFTAAFAGHAWQIDTHMAFFAALAIVGTLGSIPALLLGVVVTAVHHVAFGVMLPSLVYPSSDLAENLGRTALHAVIVVFESGVLALWMMRSARARAEIIAGREQVGAAAEEAARARDQAEQLRRQAEEAAELTRAEGRKALVAVEQIAEAARSAAEHAKGSQALMGGAVDDVKLSDDIVRRTRTAMTGISESSERISEIVQVIDEIARRTDLLALNAAVESARAGDAGRGFAVVANEVRKLAQQSADATLQIRTMVSASTTRVQEGARLVDEAGDAMARISASFSALDQRMCEIVNGAAEQVTGLQQVNVALGRIDTLADDEAAQKKDAPRSARLLAFRGRQGATAA